MSKITTIDEAHAALEEVARFLLDLRDKFGEVKEYAQEVKTTVQEIEDVADEVDC